MKIKKVLVSLGIAMAMFVGMPTQILWIWQKIMRCLIWNTLTG